MAADDLVYTIKNGVITPDAKIRKVIALGRILIGSAQLVWYRHSKIEYKFDDWIAKVIAKHRGGSLNEPNDVASAIYAECREILKPIEMLIEGGKWKDQAPGDRIISYLVAGYPESFKYFHLIEFGAKINSDGNGLTYIPPFHHPTNLSEVNLRLGEDKFLERSLNGIEPEASVRKTEWSACLRAISTIMPKSPRPLQDVIASAVSLVKVEAEFNPNKVGKTVNVVCVDRLAKKTYRATF